MSQPTTWTSIARKCWKCLNWFDGTLLFVSHDRYFINRVATQFGTLRRGLNSLSRRLRLLSGEKAELEALAAARSRVCFFDRRSHQQWLSPAKSKTRRNSGKSLVALSNWKRRWKSWIKNQDITETMHSTNDAADLVQLQSELDQLTVHRKQSWKSGQNCQSRWNRWKILEKFSWISN